MAHSLVNIQLLLILGFPALFTRPIQDPPTAQLKPPRTRTFVITYSARIDGLPAGKDFHLWLPVPNSGEDQRAKIVRVDVPGSHRITKEPEYGNRILYVDGKADHQGSLGFLARYEITRRELRFDMISAEAGKKWERFLLPDSKVPINGEPLKLIDGKKLPTDQLAAARILYDAVRQHMRYSKEGTGWGQGDAVWACESGYGNCSDFHSLFISLARSQKVPAKFEIGFMLPDARGRGDIAGYHCWAKFRANGKGWVPVDISEASRNPALGEYYFGNLTENRVTFSTGRDIRLVPKQEGPPLNFFIYPYVEVDGKPYPADKLRCHLSYEDIPSANER
jgi:transglutaminase-like putative cysteine protease